MVLLKHWIEDFVEPVHSYGKQQSETRIESVLE